MAHKELILSPEFECMSADEMAVLQGEKLKKVVKMPCDIAWHFCFNKNERVG